MRFGKKNIVIVDDSQTFVMYIAVLLRRMGFNAIPASNGLQAIKFLKIMGADAVMLDVMMPHSDGIKVLECIKEDHEISDVPVIMMSVDSSPKLRQKCEQLGCAGFLVKPLRIDITHRLLQDVIFLPIGIKRNNLRTEFFRKVYLTHRGISRKYFAQTLSEGGVYVGTDSPLPIGTEVKVSLPVKGDDYVFLRGTVIYTKVSSDDISRGPSGMAIEFGGLSGSDSCLLRNYIKNLLTENIAGAYKESVLSAE